MIPQEAIDLTLRNELRRAAQEAAREATCQECHLDPNEFPYVRVDAHDILTDPAFAIYLGEDETCDL